MRVVIAPDAFEGAEAALTAAEVAESVADGWRRQRPTDTLVQVPMGSADSGFLAAVRAALGGGLVDVDVRGPLGEPTRAQLLLVEVSGITTAYLEAGQVCGPGSVTVGSRGLPPDALWDSGSSQGVGELIAAAVQAGARRILVAVGAAVTRDAGAGLLAALAAAPDPQDALTGGLRGLATLSALDVSPAVTRLGGVELQLVSDTDLPLLGLRGSTNVEGARQKVELSRLLGVDATLTRMAELAGRRHADRAGAGSGGGIGFALLALGGERVPGVQCVAELVGLSAALRGADLVLTGERLLDWQSLRGRPVAAVVRAGNEAAVPCVGLGAQVEMGSRELRNGGLEAAYAAGTISAEALRVLGERVARTWGRAR